MSAVKSPLERLRGLFVISGRTPSTGRYEKYGLFDAHTGKRVGKAYDTRHQAEAAKTSSPEPHRMRVRGIPPKKKPAKKKAVA